MNQRHALIDFELLARLLDFPDTDFFNVLDRCEDQVFSSDEDEVRCFFYEFVEYARKKSLADIQELYVSTFRCDRKNSLFAADYLLSEDDSDIVECVSKLDEMYSAYGFQRHAYRSDFIPELIRFAPLLSDDSQFDLLLNNFMLFPIISILNRISDGNLYNDLLSFVGNCVAAEIDQVQRSSCQLWAEIA
jgi:nitrate reductase assembly molybdenum cofactor insertion protein NarJ